MGVSPALFWGLFQTACAPVVRVLLLCGTGAWLARIKVLTPEVSKGLNQIVFVLLLPCLIFANLASAIDADKFILWWYMPINVLLCCLVGGTLGYALTKVCRIPRTFVALTVASCTIGNLGNLPLVLIDGICNDPHATIFPGSVSSCLERGVAYVSYGMWPATFVMWTYVYWLLAPPKSAELGRNGYLVLHRKEAIDSGKEALEMDGGPFDPGAPPSTSPFDSVRSGLADAPNSRGSAVLPQSLHSEPRNSFAKLCRTSPLFPVNSDEPVLPAGTSGGAPVGISGGVPGGVARSSRLSSRRNSASEDESSEGGSGGGTTRAGVRLFKDVEAEYSAKRADVEAAKPLTGGPSRFHSVDLSGAEVVRRKPRLVWDTVAEKSRRWLKRFTGAVNWKVLFTPPIIAVFVAMAVGMCPGAKGFMFGPTAYLKIFTDTIEMLAEAMIPCMMLVLGGNLASGPGRSDFGATGLVGVIVTRLLLLPLMGIVVVFVADHLGILPPSDHMFRFVLMLQFSMPSAINIGTVAALHNYLEKEASLLLFWQYVLSAVTTTFFVTLFLGVLTLYD